MKPTTVIVEKLDIELLHRQKVELVSLLMREGSVADHEDALDGILNLLDYITDKSGGRQMTNQKCCPDPDLVSDKDTFTDGGYIMVSYCNNCEQYTKHVYTHTADIVISEAEVNKL